MKRILIVDDEPTITLALRHHLERNGYKVLVAHSGGDALDLLAEQPDMLLLDLMLPDITGYEVCRNVRKLERYTPVLMLTAKDTLQEKVQGLNVGADAYLTKPYHNEELLAHVKALLRMVDSHHNTTIECGDLVLYPDSKEAKLAGELLDLSTTEYAMLELFMRSPKQVFGRETLLRNVWGYSDVNVRSVDTVVLRLRQKIEKDPKEPLMILTVRGFGYRFMCDDD